MSTKQPRSPTILAPLLGVCICAFTSLALDPSAPATRTVRLQNAAATAWIPLAGSAARPASQPPGPRAEPRPNGFLLSAGLSGLGTEPMVLHGGRYRRLEAAGWTRLEDPGHPVVPVKHFLLPIPAGVAPRVHVRRLTEVRIEGLDVEPAQDPPWDGGPEPAFRKEEAVYTSAEFYPRSNVVAWSVGHLRHQAILSLAVTPVRVQPAQHALRAAVELVLEITWEPLASAPQAEPAAQAQRALNSSQAGLPAPYLILLNDQFADNPTLAEFVDWKQRKGYDVRLVRTSQLQPGGAPSADAITSFLRQLPAADYPAYLLTLGSADPANGVAGRPIQRTPYNPPGFYDLDYACRDTADFYPDLSYGRLPARDNRELTLMLSKCLAADRTPPASNNMYQRVLVAATLQDTTPRDNRADRLFCETADAVACYFEQAPGGVAYDCWRAVVNPQAVTPQCYWNNNSILWQATDRIGPRVWNTFLTDTAARLRLTETLNAGVSLLLHRDHGLSAGWSNPSFTAADVRRLANGAQRPLVMSINCLTGNYMAADCFASAWLGHETGGAYAVIAAVDVSTSWCNDWMVHGFFAGLLPDYISWHNLSTQPDWPKDLPPPSAAYGTVGGQTRLGPLLNFAKMYMLEHNRYAAALSSNPDTFRIFQVFGDPEAHVLLPRLRPLHLTGPSVLAPGSQSVVFDTGEPGTLVCLYAPELGLHQAAQTDAAGRTSFAITPTGAGPIAVTATRYGCRPYEGTLRVQNPADLAPRIQTQPESQIVLAGGTARFSVAASGAPPLSYQWLWATAPLGGAGQPDCVLAQVQLPQAGPYSVIVSNAYGSATSQVAVLTIVADIASQFLFAQPEWILIADDAPATPYPSRLHVAGVTGWVTNVTVTLSNLTHSFTRDVAALLVSPAGQSVVLLSETGGLDGSGQEGAAQVTLVFDSRAASPLPPDQPLASGVYQPSDGAALAVIGGFPPPAPDGLASTNLLPLLGGDPNGFWSLFLWDRARGDAGLLEGGWRLDFATDPLGAAAPDILQQPEGFTVFSGNTVQLQVEALGTAPLACQWFKDGVPVAGANQPLLRFDAMSPGQAGGYSVTLSNRFGFAISAPAPLTVLTPGPLAASLDHPALAWITYGEAAWAGQTRDSHDGVSAARTGRIGNNAQSTLQTTVTGPGLLSFWWRVSAEEGYDWLTFQISGETQAAITGDSGWESKSFRVPAGSQLLEWSFAKDFSFKAGEDVGWVDQVSFAPTLGRVDHLEWSLAGEDNLTQVPFAVSLVARDDSGFRVESYDASVAIRGAVQGPPINLLGDRSPQQTGGQGEWGYTDAYDFTPDTDLLLTGVRSCYGAKVCLWLDDGSLLLSQPVANLTPGLWSTTPLPAPVLLQAATRYRLGVAYASGERSYYLTNFSPALPLGVTGPGWFGLGDTYPQRQLEGVCPLVDINYLPLVPAAAEVSPTRAVLRAGAWEGSLAVAAPVPALRLWADDGAGHTGLSQPFNVVGTAAPQAPAITVPPQSQTLTVGSPLTLSVWATGSAPLAYAWQRDGVPLSGATNRDYVLFSVHLADSGSRFVCVVSNAAGGAVSAEALLLVAPAPIPLSQTLNDPALAWSTRGNAPWFAQTSQALDGIAAQSGALLDSQESVLQTIVTGPGFLRFWWQVSSEPDLDTLSFWVDGTRLARLSGAVAWTAQNALIPSGAHVLRWIYSKDVSNALGLDAAWVDKVSYATAGPRLDLQGAPPALRLRVEGPPGTAWSLLSATSAAGPWKTECTLSLPDSPLSLPLTNSSSGTRFFHLAAPIK